MKNKFALLLGTACLMGAVFAGGVSHAETPMNIKPQRAAPSTGTPGSIAIPATMKCMSGYTKTDEHINSNGAVDKMTCQSPVYECPHKSKVINKNGAAANGQGIDVKKIPVGNPGDTNRFKLEYTCTYIWAQG